MSPEFKKFQIGISFSTDYSFRTLKGDNEQWIKQQKVKEFPKIFYTTGINIVHNFTRNIGLETGLQYSHKGYENRVPFSNIWCGVGLPNSKIANYKEVYNYHYIDVPLAVNFSIGNGKVRLVSSLGLTTNVLLKYTIRSVYPSETKHKSKTTSCYRPNNNTINLSPTISIGIDYKITDALSLRISPTFRHQILKINESYTNEYLWNTGINIGLYL